MTSVTGEEVAGEGTGAKGLDSGVSECCNVSLYSMLRKRSYLDWLDRSTRSSIISAITVILTGVFSIAMRCSI